MFQTKVVEKIRHTFYVQESFSENFAIMRWCRKVWYSQTGHRWQYNNWLCSCKSLYCCRVRL